VIGDVPWPCARQARRWASARRKTRRTSLLEGGRERLERWRWDRGSRNHDRPAPSIKASPKAETIFPPCSAVSSRSIDRDSAIVLFFRLRAHTFRRFSGVASERAMSGGEAACARFPVEHSWFLNRARRRHWAREWLSPLQDVGRIEKFGDGDGARSAAGIAHGARTSGARARKGHPPLWVRGQAPVRGADLRGGPAPTSDRSGASDRRLRGAHFIIRFQTTRQASNGGGGEARGRVSSGNERAPKPAAVRIEDRETRRGRAADAGLASDDRARTDRRKHIRFRVDFERARRPPLPTVATRRRRARESHASNPTRVGSSRARS